MFRKNEKVVAYLSFATRDFGYLHANNDQKISAFLASHFEKSNLVVYLQPQFAGMAKLVDVPDLGSGAARRVGSSPIARTSEASLKNGAFFLQKLSEKFDFFTVFFGLLFKCHFSVMSFL